MVIDRVSDAAKACFKAQAPHLMHRHESGIVLSSKTSECVSQNVKILGCLFFMFQ